VFGVIIIKILCLDQATKTSGYSVFENKKLITYGILQANENEKNPIERMKQMQDRINELIDKIKPSFIVFEDIQFQQNYGTFKQLAQLQGILMAKLFKLDIGFQIIEPSAGNHFVVLRDGNVKNKRKILKCL
jgi:Holliday junction resolvasome RuvABC endonuclease subunit